MSSQHAGVPQFQTAPMDRQLGAAAFAMDSGFQGKKKSPTLHLIPSLSPIPKSSEKKVCSQKEEKEEYQEAASRRKVENAYTSVAAKLSFPGHEKHGQVQRVMNFL